jgi:hypothetical protein
MSVSQTVAGRYLGRVVKRWYGFLGAVLTVAGVATLEISGLRLPGWALVVVGVALLFLAQFRVYVTAMHERDETEHGLAKERDEAIAALDFTNSPVSDDHAAFLKQIARKLAMAIDGRNALTYATHEKEAFEAHFPTLVVPLETWDAAILTLEIHRGGLADQFHREMVTRELTTEHGVDEPRLVDAMSPAMLERVRTGQATAPFVDNWPTYDMPDGSSWVLDWGNLRDIARCPTQEATQPIRERVTALFQECHGWPVVQQVLAAERFREGLADDLLVQLTHVQNLASIHKRCKLCDPALSGLYVTPEVPA